MILAIVILVVIILFLIGLNYALVSKEDLSELLPGIELRYHYRYRWRFTNRIIKEVISDCGITHLYYIEVKYYKTGFSYLVQRFFDIEHQGFVNVKDLKEQEIKAGYLIRNWINEY